MRRLMLLVVVAVVACTASHQPPPTSSGDTTYTSGSPNSPVSTKRVIQKVDPDTLIAADLTHCVVPQKPHYIAVDTGQTFNCVWR